MKSNKKQLSLLLAAILFLLSIVFVMPQKAYAKASSYAVIDLRTKTILDESLSDVKMPMASTTKIMTAITAIENIEDLDEKFAVSKSAVGIEGSSVYLKAGEAVSVRELLYCLMLRSGNDAAVALSVITSGSVDNFVKLMNEKATEIGAINTHFANPHGLHDDNHYTTAKDLAIISAYAMENTLFREIVSTKTYKGERGVYKNKNKMLFEFDGADGIKTGYTKAAGRCLVSSATRNGNTVICIVLNCNTMYETSKKLINDAFSNYNFITIRTSTETDCLPINGIPRLSCFVATKTDVVIPIKKGEEDLIHIENVLPSQLDFPVKKGEQVGQINVFRQNDLLFSQKIYTIESVGKDELIFS